MVSPVCQRTGEQVSAPCPGCDCALQAMVRPRPRRRTPAPTEAPTETHVVIDLETMGTSPAAPIIALGAVFLAPQGGLGMGEFYQPIDLASSIAAGSDPISPSTVAWWLKQSAEARQALEGGIPLTAALQSFSRWFKSLGPVVGVWGNGSDFDNVLLTSAYRYTGLECPWQYHQNRCYRTLKNLLPNIPRPDFGGQVQHNALHDARVEGQHLLQLLRALP